MSSDATPSTGNGSPTSRARVLLSWGVSVVLGVVVYMVYISNQREIGTFDTAPITATAVCLNRGDGLYIERFLPCWGLRRDRKLPTYLAEWRGRIISRYPIAPAFLALPFVACQTAYCDWMVPGWDRYPPVLFYRYCLTMAKVAAAMIAALTAVVLHRVLSEMGLVRVAIPATLAAAFGSELWMVASQALWGHGPAALALITSVWLLLPRDPARWRLLLAGVRGGGTGRLSPERLRLLPGDRRLGGACPSPTAGLVPAGADPRGQSRCSARTSGSSGRSPGARPIWSRSIPPFTPCLPAPGRAVCPPGPPVRC